MRDTYSNFQFFQVIEPGTKTAAVTGKPVDKQGFDAVTFAVNVLDFSNASVTSAWFVRMLHGDSDINGTVQYSNVPASLMLFDVTMNGLNSLGTKGFSNLTSTGSGAAEGICIHFGISNGSDNDLFSQVFVAGYIGNKRWVNIRLSQSTVGDVSAIILGAIAVKGYPNSWPVNTIDKDA